MPSSQRRTQSQYAGIICYERRLNASMTSGTSTATERAMFRYSLMRLREGMSLR